MPYKLIPMHTPMSKSNIAVAIGCCPPHNGHILVIGNVIVRAIACKELDDSSLFRRLQPPLCNQRKPNALSKAQLL